MKSFFSHGTALALSFVICQGFAGAFPIDVQAASSGTCGNAEWAFADGTLTISGGGCVYAYSENGENPYGWDVYRDEITTVIVKEGVACLGWDPIGGLNTETYAGYCFRDYVNLETVQLPSTLQLIGVGCFAGCTALTEIALPDSLLEVRDECFAGCTALTDVYLPTSASAGKDAFKDTPFLVSFGDFVMLEEGALYSYEGTDRTVTVPEGVTSIYPFAFQDNTNVTHVKLPSTLKHFNAEIFKGCTGLCQLTIPSTITSIVTPAPTLSLPEIIYGETGSAAEEFANKNNLHFIDPSAYTNLGGADMTLAFSTDVWSFGNSGSVFGSEYYLTEEARTQVVEQWLPNDAAMLDRAWGGSCFGLSATVVLAKAGLLPFAQLQQDAVSLHDVEPTNEVLSLINYYHHLQFDSDYLTAGDMHNKSQLQRLCQLIFDLKTVSSGGSPSVLSYVTPSGGQHAVVAYGLEEGSWKWDGVTYDSRILIWDSNFHTALDDRACLYYDSDTMDYCIPYYGIVYARGMTENSGKIAHICNDTDLLSAYPYPLFEAVLGDANGDGICTVADAVMLQKWLTCQGTITHPQAVDLDENLQLDAVDLSLLKQLLLVAG